LTDTGTVVQRQSVELAYSQGTGAPVVTIIFLYVQYAYSVGAEVGATVGSDVGEDVGSGVGAEVGEGVGSKVPVQGPSAVQALSQMPDARRGSYPVWEQNRLMG